MRPNHNSFTSPVLLWTKLSFNLAEMAFASMQVIGHRNLMLQDTPGRAFSAEQQAELARMGQEKYAAVFEAFQAAGLRMMAVNQRLALHGIEQVLAFSSRLAPILFSRSGAELANTQAALMRGTIAGSLIGASKVASSTAQLTKSALQPVHRRVKANVARLGKR